MNKKYYWTSVSKTLHLCKIENICMFASCTFFHFWNKTWVTVKENDEKGVWGNYFSSFSFWTTEVILVSQECNLFLYRIYGFFILQYFLNNKIIKCKKTEKSFSEILNFIISYYFSSFMFLSYYGLEANKNSVLILVTKWCWNWY